ncbi:unnamed protein product [Cladocopium goreaui]|uniref:Conserved oligomeric Golgi complex subunit 1 n=1 Tax=Cladocopium goreaui TaxID=2562237 RepID=A0A9P1G0J8_9DINO|nr:unnamed protein product [Cladocopium goreaui]
MATAFLQLSLVSLVLTAANIVGHLWEPDQSWIFGPHPLYKLRHVGPVGLLFGFKYGVTNWGLQILPVGMHLLLQSTEIVWAIILAEYVNGEDLGVVEILAAFLSGTGSFLIGLHAVDTLETPLMPILVNLLPPLILALCLSTLRMGAQELFRSDNRLAGSISVVEFTAMKLALSALTALVLAMLCERGTKLQSSWWKALAEESDAGVLLVLLGGVFILIFQVNLTWLTSLTSVATVGIIGGVKIIPQWILNAIFQLQVDLEPLNILGAFLVLAAKRVVQESDERFKGLEGLAQDVYSQDSVDSQRLVLDESQAQSLSLRQRCQDMEMSLAARFPSNDGGDGFDDEDEELVRDRMPQSFTSHRDLVERDIVDARSLRYATLGYIRHFDIDRTRGSLLTSQSIFQIGLDGYSAKHLQEFSGRVLRTLNSVPQGDWPSQRMMGEWLFHRLRQVRKLERTIDEIKRSDAQSSLRDFDHLWNRLQEHLLEEREDINAQSIENLLKSSLPKKLQPDKPTRAPAAIAPSSESKTSPKGKAKGKGKAMTAEQKAKTACIFYRCQPFAICHRRGVESYGHAELLGPVEAKKTELRELVGDHYRSVLESSDHIRAMSDCAVQVAHGAEKLESLIATMWELAGKPPQPDNQWEPETEFSLCEHVMELLEMPEKVRGLVAELNFVKAAKAALVDAPALHSQVQERLRVESLPGFDPQGLIAQQAAAFRSLPRQVAGGCVDAFAAAELTPAAAAEAFVAHLVLDEAAASSLLRRFIACRSSLLRDILEGSGAAFGGDSQEGLLQRLSAAAMAFEGTIVVASSLCTPGAGGAAPPLLASALNRLDTSNEILKQKAAMLVAVFRSGGSMATELAPLGLQFVKSWAPEVGRDSGKTFSGHFEALIASSSPTTCSELGQLQRLFTQRLTAFRRALAESVGDGRDWPALWKGACGLFCPGKGVCPDSLSALQRCVEQSCAQLVKERLRELKLVLVKPGELPEEEVDESRRAEQLTEMRSQCQAHISSFDEELGSFLDDVAQISEIQIPSTVTFAMMEGLELQLATALQALQSSMPRVAPLWPATDLQAWTAWTAWTFEEPSGCIGFAH